MDSVSFEFFDRPADIAACLQELGAAGALAVDFEADSFHSYQEKLCLVQVTAAGRNAVLDPLTGRDALGLLGETLGDPEVDKVFHGADYDVRLLKKDLGFSLRGLFDTMIAAQLTGRSRVGLAALLEEHFGVVLDKRYQRADWSARPLSPELLAYAALDTAYLLPLREKLEGELASLGRLEWAREEFRLLESVTPAPPKPLSCLDVKGAARLSPRQLAILQALLEVREEAARQWDRPPFKVLSNDVLLAWAQHPPESRHEVLKTPRAGRGVLGRLAEDLLAAVETARKLPDCRCPRPSQGNHVPLTPSEEKALKRLKAARVRAHERLGIDPGLLVNSATLERLARLPRDEAASSLGEQLKGWQLEAVGDDLRRALAG